MRIALATTFLLFGSVWLHAQTQPAGPNPAARAYRHAFQSAKPLVDAVRRIDIDPAQSIPEADEILDQAQPLLDSLASVRAMPRAQWSYDYRRGANEFSQDILGAWGLARLLVLDGQRQARTGHSQQAADRFADALELGRNLGATNLMVRQIQSGVGDLVAKHAAAVLPLMTADARRRLGERMDALPPPSSPQEWVAGERVVRPATVFPLVRLTPDQLAMVVGIPSIVTGEDTTAEEEELRSLAQSKLQVLAGIAELQAWSADAEVAAVLPLDELVAAWPALEARKSAGGILLRSFGTPFLGARQRFAEADTKVLMLRAAIDVLNDGEGALANHPDPLGDGPFKTDTGFELRSAGRGVDQEVVLKVGGK